MRVLVDRELSVDERRPGRRGAGRGGRRAPHRPHASRRAVAAPRRRLRCHRASSAARRMRSTTRTIPIFPTRWRWPARFGEAGKAGARHLPRRAARSPAPTGRKTSSAGRSSSAGTRCARPMPGAPTRCFPVVGGGAPLFHWHADTFTLPPGAVHLAESDMTQMQAFRIGRASYGIQFHFEAGTELVESWNARIRRRDRRVRARLAGAASRRGGAARCGGRRGRVGDWRAPGSAASALAHRQAAESPARNEHEQQSSRRGS